MESERTPADVVERIFHHGWSRGAFDGLEDAFTSPFTFHIRGTARPMDLADLRGIVEGWRTAFPDLRFEIEAMASDPPLVAVRARLTGTHRGTWGDRPPTGNRIDVEHMFFLRFSESRVAEVWEMLDGDALRSQLSDGDGS